MLPVQAQAKMRSTRNRVDLVALRVGRVFLEAFIAQLVQQSMTQRNLRCGRVLL